MAGALSMNDWRRAMLAPFLGAKERFLGDDMRISNWWVDTDRFSMPP
jgi:hypothetical protein